MMGVERKVKLDRYTCDAHLCDHEIVVEPDEIAGVFGYHGMAQRISPTGGTRSVAWFACSENHILDAVLEAIAKDCKL